MTKICPICHATVLSTSQPERMGTVTDKMVEAAWAAIVGGDIAKTCFNASIIRADLKTGLAAALAATPADEQFNAVLDSYADENQRLSDQLREKCAELASCNQHLDAAYEAAGLSKSSSKPLAYHILELLAASPAVGGPNPMDFFSKNVDAWGAAEWFDRMATAIRQQDAAVLEKDDVNMEICRNVAASSAMRLVREYEQQVRAALAAAPAVGGERERIARLVCCGHGGCLYQGDSEDGEKCYVDTTDFNGSGLEKTTDAILAAQPASPLRGRDNEVLEEMRESGTVDAFEEADFAILYREIPESGTTTLQEITNVPQAFCLEIARLIASPPEQPAAARAPIFADVAQIIQDGWYAGRSSVEVAEQILREFDAALDKAPDSSALMPPRTET